MIRTFLATTAIATLLSTGAFAQGAPANTMAPATTAPAVNPSILATGFTAADEDNLATNIIGRAVYSSDAGDAERIGEVNNLVIGDDGSVEAVIIGVGGFLGIGEKNVAVNFSEMQSIKSADNSDRFVLATTKDALTTAPDFKAIDTGKEAAANGNAMAPANGNAMAPANGNAMAPAAVPAPMAAPFDRSTLTDVTLTTDQLVGTQAYGPADEHLGKISDVVLGQDGTTVDAVVVDFGGFLGIGTKPVAVAAENLRFAADPNKVNYVFLNVTRDQLDKAVAFDRNTWATARDAQLLVTPAL